VISMLTLLGTETGIVVARSRSYASHGHGLLGIDDLASNHEPITTNKHALLRFD
jgi:hypothetical protein